MHDIMMIKMQLNNTLNIFQFFDKTNLVLIQCFRFITLQKNKIDDIIFKEGKKKIKFFF